MTKIIQMRDVIFACLAMGRNGPPVDISSQGQTISPHVWTISPHIIFLHFKKSYFDMLIYPDYTGIMQLLLLQRYVNTQNHLDTLTSVLY